MSNTCKNCYSHYTGNYCPNCGQSSETERINFYFLWHNFKHGLLHLDKGIFYSGKQLYTRPGHTIREYIQGKRINHFKPISLVIVLASVYGLLYHGFQIKLPVATDTTLNLSDFNEWSGTHFSWLTLMTIPIYTIGTALSFWNQGYNLAELFILNTFKASQRLYLHIATFPVLYFYNHTPHQRTVTYLLYAVDLLLIFWTNIQFFNHLSIKQSLLRSIISHVIFLSLLSLCILIVTSLYAVS